MKLAPDYLVVCGYDAREAIGFHAFAQSFVETTPTIALKPVGGVPGSDGSNDFTYARFRIPEMMGWSGWVLWLDGSDMLLRADLAELMALKNNRYAVQVVKHSYKTRHPRKYVGTEMECANVDYPRKNWSSVTLWNCAHPAHFKARDVLRGDVGPYLHRFGWLDDAQIGELPIEWNWLADEYGENPDAKLLHWTAGIPGFANYRDAPHAAEWYAAVDRAGAAK